MKRTTAWAGTALLVLLLLATAHAEDGLQKNNGKRWAVLPSMMAHLQALETTLAKEPAATVAEHRDVAEKLDGSLNLLIASCTMTGPAHDELHKWLMPFMSKVKTYQKTTELKQLQQQRRELRDAFVVFHQYFE